MPRFTKYGQKPYYQRKAEVTPSEYQTNTHNRVNELISNTLYNFRKKLRNHVIEAVQLAKTRPSVQGFFQVYCGFAMERWVLEVGVRRNIYFEVPSLNELELTAGLQCRKISTQKVLNTSIEDFASALERIYCLLHTNKSELALNVVLYDCLDILEETFK